MIAGSIWLHSATHFANLEPQFSFPQGAVANEEIVLRWIHFVSGIIWIGLLYFFNLIGGPTMKSLDEATRKKVYPELMSRAMTWFRWSALVTVLVGLRYYMILLQADADNAGRRGLMGRWIGEWFLVWIVAYAILYALQMPFGGPLGNSWVRAILIAIVVIAASWVILDLNAGPEASNAHLAISVGGGLGFVMLFNVWGIVWRVQKRLIQWTRANVEKGLPIPLQAERMMRFSNIASRTAFWLSFPMLFFMAAAEHFPFLGSLGR
ncbi:MAG TPA: urate hydroxylase PuuD [Candidatus Acidoferrales bacterium]|nr:urate hydroxylase PuuD [Candidatus Acidoferrales bacterium]